MRILMLTGKFGMGHYSAASSLAQRLESANPDVHVIVEDIFDYALADHSQTVYKAFGFMVTKGSLIYNNYYNKTNEKGPDMKPVFLPYFMKKLEELVERTQPDAIWSTLPFCSQLVSWYKEKRNSDLMLVTCITDISSHSEWINSHTDCYLVPSTSVRRCLMKKGVCPENIFVCGIPVRPEFVMEKHSHPGHEKHILIMGGGLGLLPSSDCFYEELNRLEECQVTIIAGHNKELYGKYHGRYENIDVIGFTNEVYRFMAEADVVISKPGGITLFETIYSETPLLVFEPYLQQEINNTDFIKDNGIGMILKKEPEACLENIIEILQDELLLYAMKNNVKRLKREYGYQTFQAVLQRAGIAGNEVAAS